MLETSLAALLADLAGRLAGDGRHTEAVSVLEEAVRIYRELASEHPEEFRPVLAGALGDLATLLTQLDRTAEAQAAWHEARMLAAAPT